MPTATTIAQAAIIATLLFLGSIAAGIVSAKGAQAHPKEISHCHPGGERLTRCH